MECLDIVKMVFEFVTIVVAIREVFLTRKQIMISNKQALLDRRISNYTIYKEMYDTCGPVIEEMRRHDERCAPAQALIDIFSEMGSGYLADVYLAFKNPHDVDVFKPKTHKSFLITIQDMKNKSFEASVIFRDNRISEFYELYAEFLMNFYKHIVETKTCNGQEKIKNSIKNWFSSFNKLDKLYEDIKNKPFNESLLKLE